MKRNIVGKNGRHIIGLSSSGLPKPWSTSPWRSAHRIDAHHGYRIDGAELAQVSLRGAPQTPKYSGKRANDQLAALNAWEDDGGSTSGAPHPMIVKRTGQEQ